MRSVATSLATLALWACSSTTGPGGATAGAANTSSSSAGSSGVVAGTGSVAGGPTAGSPASNVAGGPSTGGSAGTASGGLGGSVVVGGMGGLGVAGSAAAGAANAGAGGSGPLVCPASVTIKAGDNNKTLMAAGVQRTYLVHTPPGYTGKTAVPVMFDFHGLSGNGAQQKSLSRWDKVGDSDGFIVVYPDGIDKAWNAGL